MEFRIAIWAAAAFSLLVRGLFISRW